MRTALQRLLQGLLVLALIPFLLDVPTGANASAESLLAAGAAPNGRVVTVEGRRTVVAEAGSAADPALFLIHGFVKNWGLSIKIALDSNHAHW